MFFSVIVPVYNRPDEVEALLKSLENQSYSRFEVVVVEDGSSISSKSVCDAFKGNIELKYIYQDNQGQGFARNTGMKSAMGDFFVILDSDVVLPNRYLEILSDEIRKRNLDAFGGPDAAAEDFSPMQKAMDYAMTSFWTTGGIRGKLKDRSKFQARGFNMGFSRKVFELLHGFIDPNRGEDIELSIRIKKAGFKLELVPEAWVYHKRKNTWVSFAKQAFSFGENRVNVSRYHPEAIRLVHTLPSFFVLFLATFLIAVFFLPQLTGYFSFLLTTWVILVFFDASWRFGSAWIGGLALICSLTQLIAYGSGFALAIFHKAARG